MMSLTFGLFTQVNGLGPLGPLVWIPKDLYPSYKMDLDFWDCFERKKKLCLIIEEIQGNVICYKMGCFGWKKHLWTNTRHPIPQP